MGNAHMRTALMKFRALSPYEDATSGKIDREKVP